MRRVKLLGLALLAVGASSIVTATASAETGLPQIGTALPGEAYPIIGEGTVKATGEDDYFETSLFRVPDDETRVKLEVTELGSSGIGEVELLGVRALGEQDCNSEGEPEGVVVAKGEFHLVYTSILPSTLEIAALLTYKKFLVTCGPTEAVIQGPLLGRVTPETGASGDSTSLKLAFHCSKEATQELSSYYNSEGALLTEQLVKANVSGTGNKNGCKELTPEATGNLTSSSLATMFTILY